MNLLAQAIAQPTKKLASAGVFSPQVAMSRLKTPDGCCWDTLTLILHSLSLQSSENYNELENSDLIYSCKWSYAMLENG